MSEHSKTRQELIEENAVLKEKILELERQSAEEKRTEDALRKSEERNRSILQVIPDIIIQTNGHGEYLDVRTSSEELLLLPKKELSGRNIKDLFPEKAPLSERFWKKPFSMDSGAAKS